MRDRDEDLLAASSRGSLIDVANALVAGARVDCLNTSGATPLVIAAREGHIAVLTKLLLANATVDLVDGDGNTPLRIAAREGQVGAVEKLLAAGANVDLANNEGSTSLCVAAGNGHLAVVEKLLAAGASVDLVDGDGQSALHCAALQGHEDIARMLVDAGADRSIRDKQGVTAIEFFELNGDAKAAVFLRRRSPTPATFFRAVARGDLSVVRRLANAFFVKTMDERGRTALHYAVQPPSKALVIQHGDHTRTTRGSDRLAVLRFLLDVDRVNVNAQDLNGESVLLVASEANNAPAVRLLLDHGARVDIADNAGRTPLSVAGSPDIETVFQLFYNSQQYHDKYFDLLNNQETAPSVTQIIDLVPLITSVYDLRLIHTLASVSDDPSSLPIVLKPAFDHIVANKLTLDDDACVFFKLVLERCERDNVISREEFLMLDRKAEKANTESSDWVIEMKRHVYINGWRLDAHEHHLRSVVDGVKHVHAMVLENRAAVVATVGQVEQLQSQVVAGKRLLGKLMAHTKHASIQMNQFQQRLKQADDNIKHVAMHLTNFRDAYTNRLQQEHKTKRIKTVCGIVASVAGFVIGPVLKEISDAVVDFTNPIEIVSTIYGERDIAGFLAEQSDKALPEVIKSQLEKYAISEDEFETLLSEDIALLHPEIVIECENRGLTLSVDSGRSEIVKSIVKPSLEAEGEVVVQLIRDLNAALREGLTKPDDSEFSEQHKGPKAPRRSIEDLPPSLGSVPLVEVHERDSMSIRPKTTELALAKPRLQTNEPDPDASRSTETLVNVDELKHTGSVTSPHSSDHTIFEQSRAVDETESLISPDEVDLRDPCIKEMTKPYGGVELAVPVEIPSGPYHDAISESQGAISTFTALIHNFSTEDAVMNTPSPVEWRSKTTSREKLCAAEYAYACGYDAVGDYLASLMQDTSALIKSQAVTVVFAEPTDAFAYVCVVEECRGDVDECELLCEVMGDDMHALDARIEADVEREVVQTFSWTPVEYACHLGFVDIVKYMLKELYKTMPPKQKIELMRRVRDRPAVGAAA